MPSQTIILEFSETEKLNAELNQMIYKNIDTNIQLLLENIKNEEILKLAWMINCEKINIKTQIKIQFWFKMHDEQEWSNEFNSGLIITKEIFSLQKQKWILKMINNMRLEFIDKIKIKYSII